MGIVTRGLLNRAAQLIATDITYMGIGTGLPVTVDSTLLDSELTRKATTEFIDENIILEEIFFDTEEINGVEIKTIGLFGQGATSIVNTGVLMLGDNVSLNKDSTESLTLSCEITVERG